MKVLMFGWEFPPFKSGGLGTACYDLCKGLSNQGTKVTFVMPYSPKDAKSFVKLVGVNNMNIKIKPVLSTLRAYATASSYSHEYEKQYSSKSGALYGNNIYEETERYAAAAGLLAKEEVHDIIHVHDWMTYKAGIIAREISGKPLVAHIHATEFDRTAGNPNSWIAHREFEGLSAADLVIANSNFTKQNVMAQYKIPEDKIRVVHWGIDGEVKDFGMVKPFDNPLVLFLGRVTVQKGPDYFVECARRVLDFVPDARFMMVGDGDMLPRAINRVAELGISDKFFFTGALKGDDVFRAFQIADVFVMPSVSEPFGLVALESLKNGTPIIISKQSGVSEVVNNALKTDFWDLDQLTNQIVSVLKYPELKEMLAEKGFEECQKFNLDVPAKKVINVYNEVRL